MLPEEYCQKKTAQSGSSFYYSFLFLPKPQRLAITALYAFCREVDDIVDETTEASIAQEKLLWWQKEIDALFNQHPTHPVTQALLPHLSSYQLEASEMKAIIAGMEMDIVTSRYVDYSNLSHYCWHVAGVVGRLSAKIFGFTHPNTLLFAEKLGLALQLTNIIRDVGEDARRGRIYLPINELQQFNVPAEALLTRRYTPAFQSLMQYQYERAIRCYDEALALLPPEDKHKQRTGLIMANIYRTLLEEIKRDGFHVLHQRIALTPLRKLWLAWITYIKN